MATEFRHIVRLIGKDLDGTSNVAYALTQIKGVNIRLANAIVKKAGIPLEKRVGFLSDVEIRRMEETIRNVADYNMPSWFLNRRKDTETGKDIHLITSDLDLQVKDDVERMMSMKAWRGYRHSYGLKVRGQRTRTTGRKKKSVGIKKKRGGPGGRP
ncbi:MAG: 30S ribosomal protein S13 [Candidatus Bathyarchaeota archaeon]|nr:30S ribosomal protein S13 [Candidatus Bathyarchaeota archaeon]